MKQPIEIELAFEPLDLVFSLIHSLTQLIAAFPSWVWLLLAVILGIRFVKFSVIRLRRM